MVFGFEAVRRALCAVAVPVDAPASIQLFSSVFFRGAKLVASRRHLVLGHLLPKKTAGRRARDDGRPAGAAFQEIGCRLEAEIAFVLICVMALQAVSAEDGLDVFGENERLGWIRVGSRRVVGKRCDGKGQEDATTTKRCRIGRNPRQARFRTPTSATEERKNRRNCVYDAALGENVQVVYEDYCGAPGSQRYMNAAPFRLGRPGTSSLTLIWLGIFGIPA